MICLADGRQSHFAAEALLRHAVAKESIMIFACSFDHPLIAQEIIDAVKRGARVEFIMNRKDVTGQSESRKGVETLRWMMNDTARVRAPGRLTVFSHVGFELKPVYQRYGRSISNFVREGQCHAKVMYAPPYLILGSSNWSVSSEANAELDVILDVRDEQTGEYIRETLDRMKEGAKEVSLTDLLPAGRRT